MGLSLALFQPLSFLCGAWSLLDGSRRKYLLTLCLLVYPLVGFPNPLAPGSDIQIQLGKPTTIPLSQLNALDLCVSSFSCCSLWLIFEVTFW